MTPDKFSHIKKEEYPYITSEYLKIEKGLKFTNDELIFIVENFAVSLRVLLETQYLTLEFCKKYLFDDFYCVTELDREITKEDVIQYQTHIDIEQL